VTDDADKVAGGEAGPDGWEFAPFVDIELTALGYFDDGADGLLQAHEVGIFSAEGKRLLVSRTVTSESALDGLFRWEPIEPLLLKAGAAYVVVGTNDGPTEAEVEGTGAWAPELRPIGWRAAVAGPLQYPKVWPSSDKVGPNFKFRPPASASSPTP
jgi:hypothetical protein